MMTPQLLSVILLACVCTFTDAQDSCRGLCGGEYYRGYMCQCDYECLVHDECCRDYEAQCTTRDSCKGRCGEIFRRGRLCSCDPECTKYNQCCEDYKSHCEAEETVTGPASPTTPVKINSCDNVNDNKPKEPTEETFPTFNEDDNQADEFIPLVTSTTEPQDHLSDDVSGLTFPNLPDDPSPETVPEFYLNEPSPSDLPEPATSDPTLADTMLDPESYPDEPSPTDLPEPVTSDPTLADTMSDPEFTLEETFTIFPQTPSDNQTTTTSPAPTEPTNGAAPTESTDASNPEGPFSTELSSGTAPAENGDTSDLEEQSDPTTPRQPSPMTTAASQVSSQPIPSSEPQPGPTSAGDTADPPDGDQARLQPDDQEAVTDQTTPEAQNVDPTEPTPDQPEGLPVDPENADTPDSNQESTPAINPSPATTTASDVASNPTIATESTPAINPSPATTTASDVASNPTIATESTTAINPSPATTTASDVASNPTIATESTTGPIQGSSSPAPDGSEWTTAYPGTTTPSPIITTTTPSSPITTTPSPITTTPSPTTTFTSTRPEQTPSNPEGTTPSTVHDGPRDELTESPTTTSSPSSAPQDPSTSQVPGSDQTTRPTSPTNPTQGPTQGEEVDVTPGVKPTPAPTKPAPSTLKPQVTPKPNPTKPLPTKPNQASKPNPTKPLPTKPNQASESNPAKPPPTKPNQASKPKPKPIDAAQTLNIPVDHPRNYQADDRNDTNLCSGRPASAVTTLRNGTMVVFRGHYFWVLDRNRVPGPARGITEVWGVPSPLDTVFTRCNCQGKTYIFKGNQFWRFDNDVLDPGYPKPIRTGFDGLQGTITAALSVPQHQKRKESVYFFKRGGLVQRYSYQFGTSPTCGRRVQHAVYTVRNRVARQAVSLLDPAINIRVSWRGFPTSVTSAVSIPSRVVPEGYKYYVFSRSKFYNIRMDGGRPAVAVLPASSSPPRHSANDFFNCPRTD